jgi:hypothetical protein
MRHKSVVSSHLGVALYKRSGNRSQCRIRPSVSGANPRVPDASGDEFFLSRASAGPLVSLFCHGQQAWSLLQHRREDKALAFPVTHLSVGTCRCGWSTCQRTREQARTAYRQHLTPVSQPVRSARAKARSSWGETPAEH